jgi:hypothetical protein
MERNMMKGLVALALLFALSAIAGEALPKDVQNFVLKREGCDHFRGEIPDPADAQRMKEVKRELKQLCTGTDKALAQLKRKYSRKRAVIQRLEEFDARIEAGPADIMSGPVK